MNKKSIAGIILAAGRGTRMNLADVNKVTLSVSEKPMVTECFEQLKNEGLDPIVVVVGFARESVKRLFPRGVIFADQEKQLGTADAALSGINALPKDTRHVLIINGDTRYTDSSIKKLIESYSFSDNSLFFATIQLDDPTGIGRIVRNEKGDVVSIVEEKNASDFVRAIQEVNAGCYIGPVDFFKKYLSLVTKNHVTGEYYLTDIVQLAAGAFEKIQTVQFGKVAWTGINTPDDLVNGKKQLLGE